MKEGRAPIPISQPRAEAAERRRRQSRFPPGVLVWRNLEGYLHRVDGPAVVYKLSSGSAQYWLKGKRYFTKEAYFNHSTEENKVKLLCSEEFMSDNK